MVNIPEEVMLDICVRLPVKSVGRFRCVNKFWYKLLNDHEFVQKHLDHATEINRLSLLLHHSFNLETIQEEVKTIDYNPSLSTCTGCFNITNLPFVALELLGHCNGLVFLSPCDLPDLYLWNPSTKEYKHLPEAPLDPALTTLHFYDDCFDIQFIEGGFGYDYNIEEFKVVLLIKHSYKSGSELHEESAVRLYTLGSDTWISLESIPYTVCRPPGVAQVPVNGVIYWEADHEYVGSEKSVRVILSFDFEKEIFQEMPWPDLLGEEYRTSLCVLARSLCICGFDPNSGVEVWELKECEVKKSWNQLFTIDVEKYFGVVKDFVPLQSLKNGEFLFGFDTDVGFHVHQFDPENETSRPLVVYENSEACSSKTRVYIKSLVSLKSYDADDYNSNDTNSDDGDNVEDDIL
ncbi:F-box/kelch-repeat protein At3g06240-like [Papaver somniferum]|uniref:F-box/kelch-repeat protein At3g06240-like n=1 Tax=Papaver somniferum TaxID=3469 RepID=UPI000E6FAF0D|nr:F-box/kelch-repeat protein At3g06240-like [Papaver somniferum]